MFHNNRRMHLFLGMILMKIMVVASSQHIPKNLLPKPNDNIWFDPSEVLLLPDGSKVIISWFATLNNITKVTYHVEDELVSTVRSFHDQPLSITNGSGYEFYNTSNSIMIKNYTYFGNLETRANFIGFNKIYVILYNVSDQVVGHGELKMTVSLSYQRLNDIFTLALGCIVIFLFVTMGATLDMDIIVQIIKKPIGPLIGLICQYVFMPLIGYGLGVLFFPDEPLLRLGLFLTGCSPGGGLSNMWTLLLGGSLDLSIMMTFVSTIAAFGVVPFWVFTMGPLILNGDTNFVIPYKKITISMATLAIPCAIGLAIRQFLPKASAVFERIVTPFSIAVLIFILSFGTYAYRYAFAIATWKIYFAGFALPVIGYCSGVFAAVLFKRNVAEVIAIAIETGIQNQSVALFILKFSLESPAGELTAVAPLASFLMTPAPLILAVLVKKGYEWKMGRQHPDSTRNTESNIKQLDNDHAIGVDNPIVDIQDELYKGKNSLHHYHVII